MTGEEPNDLSPNEQLAAIVASKLESDGIIPTAKVAEVQTGLANGKLKSTDWRLLIEMSLDRKEASNG